MKAPPWLLVEQRSLEDGAVVVLPAEESRHALGPLRLSCGDEVVLVDGCGATALARLVGAARGRVEAEVMVVQREAAPEGEGVTLLVALLDGKAMDWAVQKAVEIGIRRLQPLTTDRSQPGRREAKARFGHLQRVALQATKQCRRAWAMELLDARPVRSIVAEGMIVGGAFADPAGCAVADLPPDAGRALAIGPEGGFSPQEIQIFDDHGWSRLCLGEHVLRAETAAIVGGALMVARDSGALGLRDC